MDRHAAGRRANEIRSCQLISPTGRTARVPDEIALDPVLGRITFPPGQGRKVAVWVSYAYGFTADIGGGEYDRQLSQPPAAVIYQVGQHEQMTRIGDALAQWRQDAPVSAVIEIVDSGVYPEPVSVQLAAGQTLRVARGR